MKYKVLGGIIAFLLVIRIFFWPEPDYVLDITKIPIVELDLLNGCLDGIACSYVIFIAGKVTHQRRWEVLEHEYVHIIQQRREGYWFYINYNYVFLKHFFEGLPYLWNYAYINNHYEREAYGFQSESD